VWLYEEVVPEQGGGYNYYASIINAIDEHEFHESVDVVFVGMFSTRHTFKKKKHIRLYDYDVNATVTEKLSENIRSLFRKDETSAAQKKTALYHRQLKAHHIKLLYYPVQQIRAVENFPFIATNWDLAHISTYPFPEIMNPDEYHRRTNWYDNILPHALMIFCESETGKKELVNHLGYSPLKIRIVPSFAPPLPEYNEQVFKELHQKGIVKDKFFFYPAQFWAHKNHYNLLLAFNEFLKQYPDIKLVLCGSDKGQLKLILSLAETLNIGQQVIYLGFVSNDVVKALYRNAIALVFPTYLGPTNLPLSEAHNEQCPVLCSNLEGHRELMAEGALYFDCQDFLSICNAMKEVMNTEKRSELIKKADKVNGETRFNLKTAIKNIDTYFREASKIIYGW